ncbi:MAG: hypothetical protein AAF589_07485, partial [Planctomycetota bacterium]
DSLLSQGLDDLLKDLPGLAPVPEGSTPNKAEPAPRRLAPPAGEPKPGPIPVFPPDGEDLGQQGTSPLVKIETGMKDARTMIREGAGARATQEQVIADLDDLIRQAEKQSQHCNNPSPGEGSQARQQSQRSQAKPSPGQQAGKGQKSGSAQQSQQAGQRSQVRLNSAAGQSAAGKPPAEAMKEVWGRLPERLREQMLESSSEEFLPEYKEEIERYFRRLAEEPVE